MSKEALKKKSIEFCNTFLSLCKEGKNTCIVGLSPIGYRNLLTTINETIKSKKVLILSPKPFHNQLTHDYNFNIISSSKEQGNKDIINIEKLIPISKKENIETFINHYDTIIIYPFVGRGSTSVSGQILKEIIQNKNIQIIITEYFSKGRELHEYYFSNTDFSFLSVDFSAIWAENADTVNPESIRNLDILKNFDDYPIKTKYYIKSS